MSDQEKAIVVKNVHKTFRLPHEQYTSLKNRLLHKKSRKKGYELQHVLKDISFEVEKGEFFGVVGRNGSGKSTLLKLMAGVYVPDSGEIQVNGTLSPFIELGVGFNPELTGRENVFLNGALLGFNRKEMLEMYDEIVEFAELEQFMDQKLNNYSSGMQVRLAFSIAIRARGDILLLDEVLAVGDAAFQRKCQRYFEDLKNSKSTVILVTHDMGAVQRFCDRAILIESGEIVRLGTSQVVTDEYRSLNLDTVIKNRGAPKIIERNETVSTDIIDQTKDEVIFRMRHEEQEKEEFYFGFSIVKDGVTFAELNNLNSENGKIVDKKLSYKLDISKFNPGIYEISATLFKLKSKEAVAFTRQRPQFMIPGFFENRSGALYLEESWIT